MRKILDPDALLVFEEIYTLLRNHFRQILENHPDRRIRSIRDIVISKEYDFIAKIEKDKSDRYCIFLDAFVPLQLLFVFQRMMAHPEVLPTIGQPPRQHESQSLVLFLEAPEELTSGARSSPIIVDKARQDTVNLLTILAAECLIMHEAGHAVLGHFNLFDGCRLPRPHVRRGLEYSADCYAIQLMSIYDSWRRENASFSKHVQSQRFRLIGFAIGTVWNILVAVALRRGKLLPYYPNVATRSWTAEQWIADHAELERGHHIIDGMSEARKGWGAMKWPTTSPATNEEVYSGLNDMKAALVALEELT